MKRASISVTVVSAAVLRVVAKNMVNPLKQRLTLPAIGVVFSALPSSASVQVSKAPARSDVKSLEGLTSLRFSVLGTGVIFPHGFKFA